MAAISHVCRRTLPSFPFFFPCLFHQRKAKRKHILRSFSVSPNTDGIKILFPGQGSQYVGMTTRLLPLCSAALNVFSIASSVLGYDIQDLCVNGPQDKIQQTIYCQPAIVVSCLVAFEQMKHNNPSVSITFDIILVNRGNYQYTIPPVFRFFNSNYNIYIVGTLYCVDSS